jgi:hypothetical protein
MNLSRKSSKRASKVSLLISLCMLAVIAMTLHAYDYNPELLGIQSAEVCRVGLVEVIGSLLWY